LEECAKLSNRLLLLLTPFTGPRLQCRCNVADFSSSPFFPFALLLLSLAPKPPRSSPVSKSAVENAVRSAARSTGAVLQNSVGERRNGALSMSPVEACHARCSPTYKGTGSRQRRPGVAVQNEEDKDSPFASFFLFFLFLRPLRLPLSTSFIDHETRRKGRLVGGEDALGVCSVRYGQDRSPLTSSRRKAPAKNPSGSQRGGPS
jgi:hypothetical protein